MRSRARIKDPGAALLFWEPCWLRLRPDGRKRRVIRRLRRYRRLNSNLRHLRNLRISFVFQGSVTGCRRAEEKIGENTEVQRGSAARLCAGLLSRSLRSKVRTSFEDAHPFSKSAHLGKPRRFLRRCAPFSKVRTENCAPTAESRLALPSAIERPSSHIRGNLICPAPHLCDPPIETGTPMMRGYALHRRTPEAFFRI